MALQEICLSPNMIIFSFQGKGLVFCKWLLSLALHDVGSLFHIQFAAQKDRYPLVEG